MGQRRADIDLHLCDELLKQQNIEKYRSVSEFIDEMILGHLMIRDKDDNTVYVNTSRSTGGPRYLQKYFVTYCGIEILTQQDNPERYSNKYTRYN